MTEIKLTVDDRYLQPFLGFLKTLGYVSVREVSSKSQKADGASGEVLQKIEASPQTPFAEPLKEKTELAEILREQGYEGPDRLRFGQFVKEMDIREPIEELLSQLSE